MTEPLDDLYANAMLDAPPRVIVKPAVPFLAMLAVGTEEIVQAAVPTQSLMFVIAPALSNEALVNAFWKVDPPFLPV